MKGLTKGPAHLIFQLPRFAMVRRPANICAFGWKAQDFALKGVDGKTHSTR